MKPIYLTIILAAFYINISIAQKKDTTELTGPEMTFETNILDYGTIPYNSNPYRTIEFTNTGVEPLIIKNVKTSCGCLVASYPKEPIKPNEKGVIKLRYETRRIGVFRKSVTIQSNASIQVIRIKGKVLAPPTTITTEEGQPTTDQ